MTAGPRPAPSRDDARVRWGLAAVSTVVAVVCHLVLHIGPFVSQRGWTPSAFRQYYQFDQLSYLAIVKNWSLGVHDDVEPFTQTSSSPYPDLYYRFMGWFADVTGANPVLAWNILGATFQALLVAGLAVIAVVVTRRWWAALAAPLPLMVGTFAAVSQGGWQTALDSHAVLWGPFGVLFTANGESAALCLAGLAVAVLVMVASGRPTSSRSRVVWTVVAGAVVGLLAQIQTYTFLSTVFVVAYGVAAYGLALARRPLPWLGVTLGLFVVVGLVGPPLSDVSPLATLVLGLVPVVPGMVLLMVRVRWWYVVVPWVVVAVVAAPQLLETVLGVASGDPFLVYREASSSNLGVPPLAGLRSGIVVLAAIALVAGVGYLRRSAVHVAVPLGAGAAWAMGATNDLWGANQEPYRFWLDIMVLLCVGLMPWVVEAVVWSVSAVRARTGARGSIALVASVVTVALFVVSVADFAVFRRDIEERSPLLFYSDSTAALERVAESSDGGLVLADPCVDPFTLKVVWGGPTAFYNLGLAWPDHQEDVQEVLDARTRGELDATAARGADVTGVITDSACPADWGSALESAGAHPVASEAHESGGTYTLWTVPARP